MDAEDDRQERRLNIHFSPEVMAQVLAEQGKHLGFPAGHPRPGEDRCTAHGTSLP